MRFPKHFKNRGRTFATVYAKGKHYPLYRVAWSVNGKRMMKAFRTYGGKEGAKQHAEQLVKDLSKGSQVTALTPGQAGDALASLERLQQFYVATGRRVSLLGAVSEFCESAAKVIGLASLSEVADSFLKSNAPVKRMDIGKAVDEFILAEEPRTKSVNGQRPQVSPKYHYNRAIMLRRFSGAFPGSAVCDLAKEHLNAFVNGLGSVKSKSRNGRAATSAKSRNHQRATIRQFLQWAVRKDYLPTTHRLLEADAMRPEHANNGEVALYTPKEFRALLECAEGPMRAIVAIGGLAGLRTSELLRLDWADVWRVRGHIEVTAGKSKTRQRRLVQIVPALAAWLREFRDKTAAGKLCELHEITFQQHFVALCETAEVPRKANGLRHAYCTYHFALNANENLTAAQAGNSPTMVHGHYKGLATKREAQQWFNIRPVKAAKNVVHLPEPKRTMGGNE